MTTITASLDAQGVARPPDLGPCSKRMQRTSRGRAGPAVRRERVALGLCPNPAAILVRGRAYCRSHAPARAAGDVSPEARP